MPHKETTSVWGTDVDLGLDSRRRSGAPSALFADNPYARGRTAPAVVRAL